MIPSPHVVVVVVKDQGQNRYHTTQMEMTKPTGPGIRVSMRDRGTCEEQPGQDDPAPFNLHDTFLRL